MSNFPEWWFWLSGLAFVVNIVLFVGLLVAIFKIVALMQALQPKIESLTAKVEAVTEKVDALTVAARDAVDTVGGKAKGISTSIERMTKSASVQFERFSPILAGGLMALRLLSAFREYRRQGETAQPQPEDDEE